MSKVKEKSSRRLDADKPETASTLFFLDQLWPSPQIADYVLPVLIYAITIFTYLRTMNPDMAAGDWGELTTNSFTLSPSHPPGYPLFVILNYVWIHYITIWLNITGTVAYKVNLLNVVVSAAAPVVFQVGLTTFLRSYRDQRLHLFDYLTSFGASLLFAFNQTTWHYSAHAEVFALNSLFCAVIIALFVKFMFYRHNSYLYLGALFSGLALAHQQTSVIFLAILIPWILISIRHSLTTRKTIILTIVFLIGTSPYAALTLTKPENPVSWGDTSSLRGLWRHITREEYGSFQLYKGDAGKGPQNAPTYAQKISFFLTTEYGLWAQYCIPFVAILSMLLSKGKKRVIAAPLALALTFYLTFFFHLCNLPFHVDPLHEGIFRRFFMQPNGLVLIFFATGLADVIEFFRSKRKLLPALLCIIMLSIILGITYQHNFTAVDQSKATFVRSYGRSLLDSLPPQAAVFVSGDIELYSMSYLRYVEHVRPDVTVISTGFLSSEWNHKRYKASWNPINWPAKRWAGDGSPESFTIGMLLSANLPSRPIAFIPSFPDEDSSWRDSRSYTIMRTGMAQVATLNRSPQDAWTLQTWPKSLDNLPMIGPSEPFGPDSWELRTWELVNFYRFKVILELSNIVASNPTEFLASPRAKTRLSQLSRLLNVTQRAVERMQSWVPAEKLSSAYSPSMYRAISFTWYNIAQLMEQTRLERWDAALQLTKQDVMSLALEYYERHCKLNPTDPSCRKK